MNIAAIDQFAGRMQRVGQAGALPKNANLPQIVDELQRQLGILGDVCRALLSELRQSPRYPKDAELFLVDCRSATSNILSTAQAAVEGFGTTAGLAVFRHGHGYNLDRGHIVYFAYTPTVAPVTNGQAARGGTCCLKDWDSARTVFQVDQDAVTNQALFVWSCYPSRPPPSTITNPGASQKAGASTPQLGLTDATSPLAEIP